MSCLTRLFNRWFLYFVCVGLATGVSYYIIYGFVATHISAIAVSIALYFEPVISSLMVYLLGWQSFPGKFFISVTNNSLWTIALLTIIGILLVILGMAVISLKQEHQERMTFADESIISNSYELAASSYG